MRYFLLPAFLCALAIAAANAQDRADTFPRKPLRIVVPYAAGGSATLVARLIGARLSENIGQSVIIDNRGGGNGKIGAEAVAYANPDGYTLLFGETGAMAINVWLMDRSGSHPVKDFVAIGQVVTLDNALVAHPSFGVKNLRELVARGAAGPLVYGSSGMGTVGHLAMELLKSTLNVRFTHVPYKGGGPAITDVLGGQIPLLAITVPTAAPHVQSGRLVGLTTFSATRTPAMPNVPTVAEQGFPPLAIPQWYGYFAPAGTPAKIIAYLNAEISRATLSPEVSKALAAAGNNVDVSAAATFANTVRNDVERWGKVIRDANIKAE